MADSLFLIVYFYWIGVWSSVYLHSDGDPELYIVNGDGLGFEIFIGLLVVVVFFLICLLLWFQHDGLFKIFVVSHPCRFQRFSLEYINNKTLNFTVAYSFKSWTKRHLLFIYNNIWNHCM